MTSQFTVGQKVRCRTPHRDETVHQDDSEVRDRWLYTVTRVDPGERLGLDGTDLSWPADLFVGASS